MSASLEIKITGDTLEFTLTRKGKKYVEKHQRKNENIKCMSRPFTHVNAVPNSLYEVLHSEYPFLVMDELHLLEMRDVTTERKSGR